MSTLTKHDLVQMVMQDEKLTKVDAVQFVEDFFSVLRNNLAQGQNITISNFGQFMLRHKNSRIGRNPKTKEEYSISARTVVAFKPSNVLKDAIREHSSKPMNK